MSITQRQLEENCIYDIEKNNLEKVKQFLSSGFNINSFFRSNYKLWVIFFSQLKIIYIYLFFKINLSVTYIFALKTNIRWSLKTLSFNLKSVPTNMIDF